MRLFRDTAVCIALVGLCAAPGHADYVIPPLASLCSNPSAAVDLLVTSVNDELELTGTVNAVFLRDGGDGGVAQLEDVSPGDEIVVPNCADFTSAGARELLLLDETGSCFQSFRIDDEGVLEDGKPDVITSEEAGSAAVSDDCSAALRDAGYDTSRFGESPLETLFGCSTTKAPDGLLLFAAFALMAAYGAGSRRRRGRTTRGSSS